jgi:hypothetical protein
MDDVAQGHQEEQSCGIASLRHGGDEGCTLIRDAKRGGEYVQDRVVVIQISYAESTGLGKKVSLSHLSNHAGTKALPFDSRSHRGCSGPT